MSEETEILELKVELIRADGSKALTLVARDGRIAAAIWAALDTVCTGPSTTAINPK